MMEQERTTIRLAAVDGDWRYLKDVQAYSKLHTGIEDCQIFRTARALLDALGAGARFHLVLLDLFLLDMDPFQFMDEVNRTNLPNRPIMIFLSSVGNRKTAQTLIALGADYVMRKPDKIQDLLDTALAFSLKPEQYFLRRTRERIWWNLRQMHLPGNEAGYQYLEIAIELQVRQGRSSMGKEIYPEIGRRYKVGEKAVDSAIRRLLDGNLEYENPTTQKVLKEANLPPETQHISNWKFVSAVAQLIRGEICPGGWPIWPEEEGWNDQLVGIAK